MPHDLDQYSIEGIQRELSSQIEHAIELIQSSGGVSSLKMAELILKKTNESGTSLIKNCHVPDDKLDSQTKGPANLIKAAISVLYARDLLKSNKLFEAMRSLNETYYYFGATATITLEVAQENFRKSTSGTKAVSVRHAKTNPLKEKVIELLSTEKPKKGWPSINNAVKKISPTLIEFMKNKSFGVSEHNIEATTTKWIRKEGSLLRQAFKDNASDTALKRLKN